MIVPDLNMFSGAYLHRVGGNSGLTFWFVKI
uniref:Uncharacterized protein n=1 Tax=Arundo donax TaxID=35708 RepID=A0A0A9AI56_ARUDO